MAADDDDPRPDRPSRLKLLADLLRELLGVLGPEEHAAQQRLNTITDDEYRAMSLDEAEALSHEVWLARDRDRAARHAARRNR